jgi:hypothetical protein
MPWRRVQGVSKRRGNLVEERKTPNRRLSRGVGRRTSLLNALLSQGSDLLLLFGSGGIPTRRMTPILGFDLAAPNMSCFRGVGGPQGLLNLDLARMVLLPTWALVPLSTMSTVKNDVIV